MRDGRLDEGNNSSEFINGASGHKRPQTILVATRDDWTGKIVNFISGTVGYRTERAVDGDNAVEAASATQPDLVVLDQDLDRSNCLTICQRIRGLQPSRPVPIIILTDRVAEIDIPLARSAGVVAFLPKPSYMPELADHVRTLLPKTPEQKPTMSWRWWGQRSPAPVNRSDRASRPQPTSHVVRLRPGR
jgi:DNA-binding response OmpR family regulator